MDSDLEQHSNDQLTISEQFSSKNPSDYLDNPNDCLTDAFLTIYQNSLWCIKMFFKSLGQILQLTKEDFHSNRNDLIHSIDLISRNHSAGKTYSKRMYRELPRRQSSIIRRNHSHVNGKTKMLSNQTRVTVRSISNQNLNRAQSNQTLASNEKPPANTLGTINSHITVAPVKSSQCQNIRSKSTLLTNQNEFKQTENTNLREQLADALCRRSYEPFVFSNRGMCCGHCRPCYFPNIPFHHSDHYVPLSATPQQQQQSNEEREMSQKSKQSPQMGDASETQSMSYSVSPNIQSRLTDSPEEEPLLTDKTSNNNETDEQNHSIQSFPDHATPPSQKSEQFIDQNQQQLKRDAQILVDHSIQDAQDKYQKILQMSIGENLPDNTLAPVKEINKTKSKSAFISKDSRADKLSDDHMLCQELCNQLNLSEPNQIAEIVRILASNAPHILKEQPPPNTSLLKNANTNKDNENTLCSQLLLHPPFKPKRLIHLCPNGSIQVLSAVDEKSDENPMINQQQYRVNYSNSAVPSLTQQNCFLTNESSLALVDVQTNFNHLMFTESTSTQQSHSKSEILFDRLIMDQNSIISLQQKKTLLKYDSPSALTKDIQQNHDPIVKIDLDLNDDTIERNSEEDENSLPEIVFKRIIAPDNSITPSHENKNNVLNRRRKSHLKSRHNRSSSHTNKNAIHIQR